MQFGHSIFYLMFEFQLLISLDTEDLYYFLVFWCLPRSPPTTMYYYGILTMKITL